MIQRYSHFIKGSSYANLIKALWAVALARYVTPAILTPVKSPWRFKHLTPKKLTALVSDGLLISLENSVYHLSPVSFDLIKPYRPIQMVPRTFDGIGGDHALSAASVILNLIDQPYFYTVFYGGFQKDYSVKGYWLVPDAFVLFKRDDRVKLVCLEVENEKPDWEAQLSEKRAKYEEVAGNPETFSVWWKYIAGRFNVEVCDEGEFGFSVLCIGGKDYGWKGWEFRSN